MNAQLKHCWLRRTLWSIAIVGLSVLVLWKVPLFRHHPLCVSRPAEGQEVPPGLVRSFWGIGFAVEGRLADHYTELFTSGFDREGIAYVNIGGVVLLRLWDRIADPTGYIFNADQKTMDYLFDPTKGHQIWGEMPADVREYLLQLRRGEVERGFCEYTRIMILRNWNRD